jgi:type I restriction enzyme R subunit
MVRLNPSRMNYLETFQRMIDEYNAGSRNVDAFFEQLVAFAQTLEQEERRAIAENLSEEELAVFDLITRLDPGLTKAETRQVKEIARELLNTLKAEKLVLDWRKHQQTRAAVEVTVRDWIWRLPARYADAVCQEKTALVYQHIYDNYQSARQNTYGS